MKRGSSLLFSLVLSLLFLSTSLACNLYYRAYPPFLSSEVKPNVLIIMDNSGSMRNPAYWPSGVSRSTGVDDTFDPNRRYYGIFNPDARYSYDENSDYFYEKSSGEWSGNFLNWLTMRRWDILQKVLVGGLVEEEGDDYLVVGLDLEGHENKAIFYKKCSDGSCSSYTPYAGDKYLYEVGYPTQGFSVYKFNAKKGKYSLKGSFKIRVLVDKEPEGIIQKTANQVRYGLMVFNHGNACERAKDLGDGGRMEVFIPTDLDELVERVRSAFPENWTPLGETYYEATRYFRAMESAYNRGVDYSEEDPVDLRCRKSFVILITDGESTMDRNVPGGKCGFFDYDTESCYSCDWKCGVFGKDELFCQNWKQLSNDKWYCKNGGVKNWLEKIAESEGQEDKDFYYKKTNDECGTYYLAGVAYFSHVTDLRSDYEGVQNLTLYTVYTFGKSKDARALLSLAAKYGAFNDFNGDGIPQEAEYDADGDGVPDAYFEASDGEKLERSLMEAITDILKRASSGTSIGAMGGKSFKGAVLTQATFYPEKRSGDYSVNWIGNLYAWWFYNLPGVQNVREDTNLNHILDVLEDRIVKWIIDENGNVRVELYTSTSGGLPDKKVASYSSLEELRPLWNAGEELSYASPQERHIYTTDGKRLVDFNEDNADDFVFWKGDEDRVCFKNNKELVRFVRGEDLPGCRKRQIDEEGNTWKLGDIIYSSPAVVKYDNYSVAFVGANDGMLHAFRVGFMKKSRNRKKPVSLQDSATDPTTDLLGQELWAFIPKSVLPYLRYLGDEEYCHMYLVDLTPFVYRLDEDGDGTPDRVILIGGMRFGGGTGKCINARDEEKLDQSCVAPPKDTCSSTDDCLGLSSYFALDVTDPESPQFLWEFTDKDLGFTLSGPGIVKRNLKPGEDWDGVYAVFASGPTNYKGWSRQNLKLFVVNLKNGKLERTIDTGLEKSFGGRLFTTGFDYDDDGKTDYLYLGYLTKFRSGGLIQLDTRSDDPKDWKVTSVDLGLPVVAKVEVARCFNKPFLYFGTGRWFFKDDDKFERGYLYGLPLNCGDDGCTIVTETKENVCEAGVGSFGWKVPLDEGGGGYLKERLIADPTITDNNVVIFSTVEPNGDPCGFGGRSRVWVLNCALGTSVGAKCRGAQVNELQGTVLLQLSGTNVKEVKLDWKREEGTPAPAPLTQESHRATEWTAGVTPESAPPFIPPYSGGLVGRLLLWLER